MREFEILDVGCGSKPRGDVNIDLLVEGADRSGINPRNIPNLIKADCEFLPIRDKAFEVSHCRHLIEHLKDEKPCIEELERVTKKKIIITVPFKWWCKIADSLYPSWKKFAQEHHKHEYNMRDFKRLLLNSFEKIRFSYRYVSLLGALKSKAVYNPKFPIPIPHELRAEVYLE